MRVNTWYRLVFGIAVLVRGVAAGVGNHDVNILADAFMMFWLYLTITENEGK